MRLDIVELFKDLHDKMLDIRRINYGIITFLPTVKEA
jgi:hypothetical protein